MLARLVLAAGLDRERAGQLVRPPGQRIAAGQVGIDLQRHRHLLDDLVAGVLLQLQPGGVVRLPVHAVTHGKRQRALLLHALGGFEEGQREVAVRVAVQAEQIGAGRDLGAGEVDRHSARHRRPPVAAQAQQPALELVEHAVVLGLPERLTVFDGDAGGEVLAEDHLRGRAAHGRFTEDPHLRGAGDRERGGGEKSDEETKSHRSSWLRLRRNGRETKAGCYVFPVKSSRRQAST